MFAAHYNVGSLLQKVLVLGPLQMPGPSGPPRNSEGIGVDTYGVDTLAIATVIEQTGGGGVHNILLRKGSPLSLSGGPPPNTHLLGLKCPPARKDVSQCQRLVKNKEIIYLKVTQT